MNLAERRKVRIKAIKRKTDQHNQPKDTDITNVTDNTDNTIQIILTYTI